METPNGQQESQWNRRSKKFQMVIDYPSFQKKFGHIEGYTIIGVRYKSEMNTRVEVSRIQGILQLEIVVQPAWTRFYFMDPRTPWMKNPTDFFENTAW